MTLEVWLIYLAAGRVITWLLQVNGLMKPLWKSHHFLLDLSQCDLCLGFWVYLFLALCLPTRPFAMWTFYVGAVVLASVSTLIAHLLRIGWQTKFGITVID